MPCPAHSVAVKPAQELHPEEKKGVYLRRVEYLDGRITEEKLSEITGVEKPFTHYEIWKEIAGYGSARNPRARQQTQFKPEHSVTELPRQKEMPHKAGGFSHLQSAQIPVSFAHLIRDEIARQQREPSLILVPLKLTIAVQDSRQIPEIQRTISTLKQTVMNGREITIERIFLVTDPRRAEQDQTLLAEIIPTDELTELREAVKAEHMISHEPHKIPAVLSILTTEELSSLRSAEATAEPLPVSLQLQQTESAMLALSNPQPLPALPADSIQAQAVAAPEAQTIDLRIEGPVSQQLSDQTVAIVQETAVASGLQEMFFSAEDLRNAAQTVSEETYYPEVHSIELPADILVLAVEQEADSAIHGESVDASLIENPTIEIQELLEASMPAFSRPLEQKIQSSLKEELAPAKARQESSVRQENQEEAPPFTALVEEIQLLLHSRLIREREAVKESRGLFLEVAA